MVHLLLFLMLSATAFAQHAFAQHGAPPPTMYVTYDNAPLYDSASYMSKILARLPIGDSVAVTGKQGAFVHVLFGDRTGYLLLSNLGTAPPKGPKRSTPRNVRIEKDSSENVSSAAARSSSRASETSAPRTQCKGVTQSGKQCSRMTSDPSGYCWQHKPK